MEPPRDDGGNEVTLEIEDWVRRKGIDGKWHFVESIVADAAITKCGRRLEPHDNRGRPLEKSMGMPLSRAIGQPQLCKGGCDENPNG